MMDTVTYEIYEHQEETNCGEGPISYQERMNGKDECWSCQGKIEKVGEETYDLEPKAVDPTMQSFIEGLTDHERAILLGMCMESLRGNWTHVKDRCAMIGEICDQGVGDYLSDEFLKKAKAKAAWQTVKRKATGQYNDGRTFRGSKGGTYGKLWEEVEKDEEAMRRFTTRIPHDMTFDSFYFKRHFEEDNE